MDSPVSSLKSVQLAKNHIIFIGDSPKDSPMFAYFPHSVGVANQLRFREKMEKEPTWITTKSGGNGFAEMVDIFTRMDAITGL